MVIGLLSLMVAAIFFGAAFYVNFVEHPSRLSLDDKAALTEWKPAYKRGTAMQAPLAILGFILGLVAWWLTARVGFLIGALAMIATLAMDTARHQAGQRSADCDRSREGRTVVAGASPQMGPASCGADRAQRGGGSRVPFGQPFPLVSRMSNPPHQP
jgi:hypothetical protein